jgi:hypothetical protein
LERVWIKKWKFMPQGEKLSLLTLLTIAAAANSKLIALDRLPLGTSGRNIVDRNGTKVQLKCVNWYGAHMELYSVFGLHKRPLVELSERIADWGFNCVRMPISIDLWYKDPPVPAFALAAAVSRHGRVEGVPNFTDFETFLAEGPPAAVALCTPPDVRLEMCLAAIAAGRDLLGGVRHQQTRALAFGGGRELECRDL